MIVARTALMLKPYFNKSVVPNPTMYRAYSSERLGAAGVTRQCSQVRRNLHCPARHRHRNRQMQEAYGWVVAQRREVETTGRDVWLEHLNNVFVLVHLGVEQRCSQHRGECFGRMFQKKCIQQRLDMTRVAKASDALQRLHTRAYTIEK